MLQLQDDNGNVIPNVMTPNGYKEKITGSGTTLASGVINANRDSNVRIVCDAACHYELGTAPTATAGDNYLPANVGETIKVPKGQKIAVLITGNFYIRGLT